METTVQNYNARNRIRIAPIAPDSFAPYHPGMIFKASTRQARPRIAIARPIIPPARSISPPVSRKMSFLTDYSHFTTGNEAPPIFHTWSALSVLSSAMSRRVWVDQGFFSVYPNMYILLVGKAGIKKSTAMDVGCGLIQAVKTIPIAPASITREALTQWMSEKDSPCKQTYKQISSEGKEEIIDYTHVSMFANEFITLINANGGQSGMIELLTDIWDRKLFEVKTKNKGNDYINNPCITLLGCLTTSTLSNLFSTKIISSGFSRRCIFVHSTDYGTPVPRPTVAQSQYAAWDRCIKRILHLQSISGQFAWGPGAEEYFDEWYRSNHIAKVNADSDIIQGFLQSKPGYVLKVAMLTTLSETDNLVLTPEHLKLAVAYIDQIEPGMSQIFQGVGRNELSPLASAIEAMIIAGPELMPIKKIHATFFKDAKSAEIDEILSHLVKIGKIVEKSATITMPGTTQPIAIRCVSVAQPGSGQQSS